MIYDSAVATTGGKLGMLSSRMIVATAATAATGTKKTKAIKASPLSLLSPQSPPSVLSVPSPHLTDNNNKGYVMPYDDFVKIIDKLRIANNK